MKTTQWRKFLHQYWDVQAACKVHQLLKHDTVPDSAFKESCEYCTAPIDDGDLHFLEELTLHDTQLLLESDDNSKRKIVCIGGVCSS